MKYEDEINRLQRLVKDIIRENEILKKNCSDLGTLKKNDIANKYALEEKSFTSGHKIHELAERLDLNKTALEIEQNKRLQSESQLEKYRIREDKLMEHGAELEGDNRKLKRKLDELRIIMEENLENEHLNNARLLKENNYLNGNLRRKDEEIEDVKSRLTALSQTLKETENKNNRLVNLLNQEIDKQAEEYKQKTMSHLLNSAQESAERIKKVIKDSTVPEEPHRDLILNNTYLESQAKGDILSEPINMKTSNNELSANKLVTTDTRDRMYEKDISPTKLRKLLREEDVLQSNTSTTRPNRDNDFENNEQSSLIDKQNQINNKLNEFNNDYNKSSSKEFKLIPQQIQFYSSNLLSFEYLIKVQIIIGSSPTKFINRDEFTPNNGLKSKDPLDIM